MRLLALTIAGACVATFFAAAAPTARRDSTFVAPPDSGATRGDSIDVPSDSLGDSTAHKTRRVKRRYRDDHLQPRYGDFVYYEEAPILQYLPRPIYSGLATQANTEGVVTVQALVDTFGTVVDTRVIRSIPLLDQAAITAVRQSRWRPAYSKRRPVSVWVEVPVRFYSTGR